MTEKTRPHLNCTLFCDDVRQEMGGKISLMGILEEPGTCWIENYLDGIMVNSVPLNGVLVEEKSYH